MEERVSGREREGEREREGRVRSVLLPGAVSYQK